MKILYNNNIYEYEGQTLAFTVDMGSTSVGIPVASRLWITDTENDEHQASARWESDGSENIILARLINDDCWHDHAKESIHGTRIVELMCSDNDKILIDNTLALHDDATSSFQSINAMLTTSIDDLGTTHQRTLIIYGENSNTIYAKITFIGETISEDLDIASMAELQGLHIAPEDYYVFYEADPYEPVFSSELLNRKRKEYLLCIDRLQDKIGSQSGIIDVIKYFGYDDMYIGTLWKVSNIDSPYYKGYSVRYKDQEGNPNTLDDYDVHYKQVNRSVLVYKIIKTVDIPFDKLPQTAMVNSYGIDGNSIKLARLREVMNDQFMPAAIPIREILGECDVYYAAKVYHRACDNLTDFTYSEQNIRLSIAKEDVYEFRMSRYYALASKIFSDEFIAKVSEAEKDCMPDVYQGCMLYRLKRIQTIYEFLKDKKEFRHDDIVVWHGGSADGSEDIKVSYFVYLLTTPKTEGVQNFIADTYSCIHSEAITLMMYIYESCEYLTDKLHTDALEFPDYLWTIWQETARAIATPIAREDRYDVGDVLDDIFVDRYCGCVNVSLSSQDAFRYKWNDIHSWWDHTARYEGGSFKDGMTWVNYASINKIEWTLTLNSNPDIIYTYVCEKSDPYDSVPHEHDGIADYDIYGVPVTASIQVFHCGTYDIEAIIYDNFGHIDRLYRKNAITVHQSKCYLTGIAQNSIRSAYTQTEDAIDKEKGEDFVNKFCNSFIYGPMRYNRTFDNANGILFKLPYFPKIVTRDTDYYLYPFTIANAVESSEIYDHTDEKDVKGSSPFALPNIIPSQPTALILPLKHYDNEGKPTVDTLDTIETDDVMLWNSGETAATDCIVAIKGTNLYIYKFPDDRDTETITSRLNDQNEDTKLPFFSDYIWQVTYMPNDMSSPILMGIARTITEDTDIDDIYLANHAYTEYIDVMKEQSPINYDVSFVANKYNVVLRCDNPDAPEIKSVPDDPGSESVYYTYPEIMQIIRDQYNTPGKYAYYVHSIEVYKENKATSVPKIQGMMYNAFIGMPHYGTWNYIAGGYVKLKKFSWLVVSIDNNNIPAKHNVIWDIEYRHVCDDPTNIKTVCGVRWTSILNDEAFRMINQISREDARQGMYNDNNFPSAYLPYMFTEIGQYRISCKFMDINGDEYTVPYVVVDVEN